MNGTEPPPLAVCIVVYNEPGPINSGSYGANQPMNWNKAIVNRYGMWDPAKPNRVRVPVSGWYKVGIIVRLGTNFSDWGDWAVYYNSDTISWQNTVLRGTHGSGAAASTSGATIVKLNAGDFLCASLERTYTLYSDCSRFYVYELRGMPATVGSVYPGF